MTVGSGNIPQQSGPLPAWTWGENDAFTGGTVMKQHGSVLRALSGCAVALVVGLASPGSPVGAATQMASALPEPVVTGVSPSAGPVSGGNSVTVSGTGLSGALAVAFGGIEATSFQVVSDTEITAVAPAGAGVRDVLVLTPGGVSRPSKVDFYAYGGANPPANTSLASASAVATPTQVVLTLSAEGPNISAKILGQWCPLTLVGGQPLAPLMCGVQAFSGATALWDQRTETATVYAGADRFAVTIGAASATLTTPGGRRTIRLDPPAADPEGVTLLPLAALARIVGGKAHWDPTTATASIQATVHDPGMAQAQALLSVLSPYPGGNPANDVFGGPAAGVPYSSYVRDAFVEGAPGATLPCRPTPRAGFTQGGAGSTTGPGFSLRFTTYVLHLRSPFPELQIGYMHRSGAPTVLRCDALVLDVPTRPAPDPVPSGAVRVTVTRESGGQPLGTPTSITDPAVVRRLTSIADRLPVFPGGGVIHCPANAQGVRLAFGYGVGTNRGTVALYEEMGCPPGVVYLKRPPSRTYPALADPTLSLARAAGVTTG